MNTTSKEQRKPSFEVYYRRTQAGAYTYARSIYTSAAGVPVCAASGDFDDDVAFKATQMCLLNLKLQIEGHEMDESSENFRVLVGDVARPFAESIKGMFKGDTDGPQWYQAIFGIGVRFLQNQGTSNPVVVVKKTNAHRPQKVTVKLLQGVVGAETTTICDTPDVIREITASLGTQIQIQRAAKGQRNANKKVAAFGGLQPDTTTAHRRAERAWGAMEHYVRDLANPDTPWNRLYAIDRLNDAVWKSAETYTYFGLQAREYMRANYKSQSDSWDIVFSKPVLAAIQHAIAIANRYLPNHHKHGHSLTAFDDWRPPQTAQGGKPKFEIVRILVWPKEQLLTEEAFAVARLHKIYNIPLFYLDPSAIERNAQDEYILFCKPRDTPNTPPNDLRGMAWDPTRRDWQLVGNLSYHPLEHFLELLKHPKLVFAIDAREMLIKGTWNAFEGVDSGSTGE